MGLGSHHAFHGCALFGHKSHTSDDVPNHHKVSGYEETQSFDYETGAQKSAGLKLATQAHHEQRGAHKMHGKTNEEDIDAVASKFITRVHHDLELQKLLSMKMAT